MLHPTTLPITPYASRTANCTHRVELAWQIRVFITTAATTGARVALLALPDPTHATQLTEDMVWAATCNGRGTMVEATGNYQRTASFTLQTSTRVLSNARPTGNDNYLGYSSATLIAWCLQPPIGIGDANIELKCTIMARCHLQCLNPIPGFGLAQLGIGDDATRPHGPPAWKITRMTSKISDTMTMADSGEPWCKSHTGNIILAGGYYFDFWNHGAKAPTGGSSTVGGSTGTSKGITIQGEPCSGCVYTCTSGFPPWQTNRRANVVPKYFCITRSPVTGVCFMVGFATLDPACAQASNAWASIPPSAELCIRYDKAPTWGQFHPMNATGEMDLVFYEVFRVPGASPVYNPINTMPSSLALSSQFRMLQLNDTPDCPDDTCLEFSDSDDDGEEVGEQDDPGEGTSAQAQQAADVLPGLPQPPSLPDFFHLTNEEIEVEIQRANDWLWQLHRAKTSNLITSGQYPNLHSTQPSAPPPEQPLPKSGRKSRSKGSWWDLLSAGLSRRRKDLSSDSD